MENYNYLEEIKQLKELFDTGIITEEEFEKKKQELLFSSNKKSAKTKSTFQMPNISTGTAGLIKNLVVTGICFCLIFLLCFSKVTDTVSVNNNWITYIYSPFNCQDIRKVFSVVALVFIILSFLASIIAVFFKNKYFNIGIHVLHFFTIVFSMICFIFNATYGASFVHICSILGIIFSVILLLFEAIIDFIEIASSIKSKND